MESATTRLRMSLVISCCLMSGCIGSCGDGSSGAADSGTDADTDADADTDGDTDADSDTESDIDTEWDGGPLTPCSDETGEGEICVPGGTYLMGCMPYDTQCEDYEKPMVEVTLSPFFIDEYEATYEEILPFLNSLHDGYIRLDRTVKIDNEDEPRVWSSFGQSGGPPIRLGGEGEYAWDGDWVEEHVCHHRSVDAAAGGFSWWGAKLYCEWKGKTLPTEAQWEAAARGQTKLIWPCAYQHQSCWYGPYDCCMYDAACFMSVCDDCCIPFPVDETASCESPLGVKNMYANAGEYILNWSGDDHSECADGCTDPVPSEPQEGDYPISKGGSVALEAEDTRISARFSTSLMTFLSEPYWGVRCVRSDTPPDQDAGPDSGVDGGK